MRKNKTMSFNAGDPHELQLLTHAEQINPLTGKAQNFSKYVKRLIEEDFKRFKGVHQQNIIVYDTQQEDITPQLKDAMSSFL